MPEAAQKPTPQERLIVELEGQRNSTLNQLALMGAELMATRAALADAEAEVKRLNEELQNRAQRRAK